ncbi:MAG TPA: alcohol dehydrogenase, partial [Calditrichia bacterium]|nr:alcohol dehydrogenase [Calditrichia bacterium]
AGERLVVLSDDGELSIAGASPNGFTPLATAGVLSGRCWTVPTLLNGRLYLRDMNQMVCLDLRVENKS